MNLEKIKKEYLAKSKSYEKLGRNLADSIEVLLLDNEIKILTVTYRIKDSNSFIEKIERKSYSQQFKETEDICGIRIICYYQKDVNKIKDILSKELDVIESINKESTLKEDQFGYRSHHIIGTIKNDWEGVPVFRGLSNLKFEIQIRTILMHSWAEIEHMLVYKNTIQTPKKFRKKINRISAKLEEVDEQFEELKIEIEKYRMDMQEVVKKPKEGIELNVDTLQVFMNNNFPKRVKSYAGIGDVIDLMIEENITLIDLITIWYKLEPNFLEMEKEFWNEHKSFSKWAQLGIVRVLINLIIIDRAKKSNSEVYPKRIEKYWEKYISKK